MKKQISIEYIKWLQKEREKINSLDLKDIEVFENGMKIDIPKKNIKIFKFTGLNNIDFFLCDMHKQEVVDDK